MREKASRSIGNIAILSLNTPEIKKDLLTEVTLGYSGTSVGTTPGRHNLFLFLNKEEFAKQIRPFDALMYFKKQKEFMKLGVKSRTII